MNTLTHNASFLKQEDSTVLFAEKDLEFGFPNRQLKIIKSLWDQGKSVNYISKHTKRNPHEVFFALYEMWMDGEVYDIWRALSRPSKPSLLVPGKEILERKQRIVNHGAS